MDGFVFKIGGFGIEVNYFFKLAFFQLLMELLPENFIQPIVRNIQNFNGFGNTIKDFNAGVSLQLALSDV